MKIKISDIQKSISFINQHGILLVFPVKNQKEPLSLWNCLYPRSKMNWSWDEFADDRVGHHWMLMKALSTNKEVVYSKWFQGRATFFSRELFMALLKISEGQRPSLSFVAQEILENLEFDSPLSTKELKKILSLQGKSNQKRYDSAMKELFKRFLIVGFGEVEDGAFPSLAVGATKTIYEDLWLESQALSDERARELVDQYFSKQIKIQKFWQKI